MRDPHKILFSLPSICDLIPGVSDKPLVGSEFILAEDDWRQLEFVSRDLRSEVDEEIAKIRLIHEKASAGKGWRELHVRTKPERPLLELIRLDELATIFPGSYPVVGMAYPDAKTQISDGYAFRRGDLTVYGIAPLEVVTVVAFTRDAVLPQGIC